MENAMPVRECVDLTCPECACEKRHFSLQRGQDATIDVRCCPRCAPDLCQQMEHWPVIADPVREPDPLPGPWIRHPPPEEQIAPPKRSRRSVIVAILGWLLLIVIVAACAWVLFNLAMTRHWIE